MSQSNDFGQPQQWPPAVSPQYSPAPYGLPTTPFPGHAQQPGWAAPGAVPVQGRPTNSGPGYPPGGLPGAQAYKEPAVAWVLWVFLGFAGAHHFYLGNTGRGVAYLVGWLLSIVTLAIIIGALGFIALFVLWIIDATQMTARIQTINAQLLAANRARGLA
jgi:TM2 domain-containing membrane protein YozV